MATDLTGSGPGPDPGPAHPSPETTIAEWFRGVAARIPDQQAVTFNGGSYTYAEIDRWSDAIACRLVEAGTPPDRPVAIVAASNVPLIPAALGAAKAGYFYMTVDSTEPEERIALLLEEAKAGLSLVDSNASLPGPARALPVVDIGAPPESAPAPPAREPNPYVNLVFTSGTTGKPKGIVSRQRGFVLNALRQRAHRGEGTGARVMYRSLPGFTRANTVLGGLLRGVTLCSFNPRDESIEALARFIVREQIDRLQLTPALFRRLVRSLPPGIDLSHVQSIRCGADIVTVADVEAFRRHFPRGCVFEHGYASSETGGRVFAMRIDHDTAIPGPLVPMGPPVPGVEVRLVDDDGNDVPAGEPGELVVTGPDVIEGYWNSAESERFQSHPDRPGVHTVRTGDLVRRDEAGLYYFVGRKDFRLRIHNRRIDPLEVEAALVAVPGIREAVAVGKPDAQGEQRLVAYVVMQPGSEFRPAGIRATLRKSVPSWMIPARLYALDSMPETATAGKVDRRALIERADPMVSGGSDATDGLERQLCDIWSRTIGVPVRIHDDFFDDLGGESVVAAHLVTEVKRVTGTRIGMSMLLELNTVWKMAQFIRGAGSTARLAVQVQAGGPAAPFFCVTGRDGSVIKFRSLAAALGTGRAFYGLTFHGFDDESLPKSASAIAACYAEAIREIQPDGPYYLGGYSGGARAALEVARLLERSGERVAFLAFFDSSALLHRTSLWKRLVNRLDMTLQRPRANAWEYLRKAVTHPVWYLGEQVRKLRARSGAAFPQPVRDTNAEHARLRRDYSTAPFHGRVTLFQARNGLKMLGTEPDHGWGAVGVTNLEIVDVPGDHNTILTLDVEALAAAVARCLDRADGSTQG